jgi:hypothetical protein
MDGWAALTCVQSNFSSAAAVYVHAMCLGVKGEEEHGEGQREIKERS